MARRFLREGRVCLLEMVGVEVFGCRLVGCLESGFGGL